jgi:hypothetical protein
MSGRLFSSAVGRWDSAAMTVVSRSDILCGYDGIDGIATQR